MNGTYRYKQYNVFTREFTPHTLRVEIIDETPTQYKVKYLGLHANGNRPGYITRVRKDKVKLDGETHAPDIESVRLPYKD